MLSEERKEELARWYAEAYQRGWNDGHRARREAEKAREDDFIFISYASKQRVKSLLERWGSDGWSITLPVLRWVRNNI